MGFVRGSLIAMALLASAIPGQAQDETPQGVSRLEVQTEHLRIFAASDEHEAVAAFLSYAERVYTDVDSLMQGALPARLDVELAIEGGSHSSDTSVVLSIVHQADVEPRFARELTHCALRGILGPAYEDEANRFFLQGLAARVGERYERKHGAAAPRWLWAAYAWTEGATELEYLQKYSEAGEELGPSIVDAAGYSLVVQLVDLHGWDRLLALVHSLADNVDLCAAIDEMGFGCARVLESWDERLGAEAVRYDFSSMPLVRADLVVEAVGENRELSLQVRIVNPESASFLYFVSYVAGDSLIEEPYHAEGMEYEARIPLGEVRAGTRVRWDVAVWSETAQLWRRSGWQNAIVN